MPEAYENVDLKQLYVRCGVLSEAECESRKEVALESYVKQKNIEFKCICEMARKHVFPSAQKTLARLNQAAQSAEGNDAIFKSEAKKVSTLTNTLMQKVSELTADMEHKSDSLQEEANHVLHKADPRMSELRAAADELEVLCAHEDWTLPTYTDLLFKQC